MIIVSCVLIATALIAAGIAMVAIGNKNKNNPMVIGGWSIILIAAIGSTIALILYAANSELSIYTFLLTYVSPIFMFVGFLFAIAMGVANLVKGYEKDKDGHRNTGKIISGWALLILAILLVLAVIIPLSFIFNQQSTANKNEIRFM